MALPVRIHRGHKISGAHAVTALKEKKTHAHERIKNKGVNLGKNIGKISEKINIHKQWKRKCGGMSQIDTGPLCGRHV